MHLSCFWSYTVLAMAATRSSVWAFALLFLSGTNALPNNGHPTSYEPVTGPGPALGPGPAHAPGPVVPHPPTEQHPGKHHPGNHPPEHPPLPPATLPIPYLGCFVDSGAPYALPSHHVESPALTAAKCHAHCQSHSHLYSGVSHGNKCSCSDRPPLTPSGPEHECSLPCSGDAHTACGGPHHIHVWGAPLPIREHIGAYTYQGCFTDDLTVKSLTGKVTREAEMTPDKCAYECREYAFFGLAYATQCFCGTHLEASARRKPQFECAMRCGGEPNSACGDADRLSVYENLKAGGVPVKTPGEIGGFKAVGCWSDSVEERSLYGEVLRDGEMTVGMCARFCKGSKYMGLEYGSQCFCSAGDWLGGHAASQGECSYLCEGDKKEYCGGYARLSLYVSEEKGHKGSGPGYGAGY